MAAAAGRAGVASVGGWPNQIVYDCPAARFAWAVRSSVSAVTADKWLPALKTWTTTA